MKELGERISVGPTAQLSVDPADEPMFGEWALCEQSTKVINLLADFSDTKCYPGKTPAGERVLVYMAEKPVFYIRQAKQGWLMVVAATAGKALREAPDVKVAFIFVTDARSLAQGEAYKFPAATAMKLQRRIKNEEISLDQFYSELKAAMVTVKAAKTSP